MPGGSSMAPACAYSAISSMRLPCEGSRPGYQAPLPHVQLAGRRAQHAGGEQLRLVTDLATHRRHGVGRSGAAVREEPVPVAEAVVVRLDDLGVVQRDARARSSRSARAGAASPVPDRLSTHLPVGCTRRNTALYAPMKISPHADRAAPVRGARRAVLEWCRYLHNHAPSQDLRGLPDDRLTARAV